MEQYPYPRVRPPRPVGERTHEKTTMSIPVYVRDLLDGIASRWRTSRSEALRYLAQLADSGLIPIPAPRYPIVIDYDDKPPYDIEVEAVEFVRSICSPVTRTEAEARIVELIRLAGCEARSVQAKVDNNNE